MFIKVLIAIVTGMLALIGLNAAAQTSVATTPATPVAYSPSMSDLMNIGVQPRHIKLWMAGKEQNWVYAAYELDELRGAFARVGRTTPVYRSLDIPQVITAFTKASMEALDAAIKARDAKAFTAAYGELTASCNACHIGADHSMVVIKVPTAISYVDQDFRAVKH